MAINNLSQKNMELDGIKLIILGALLLIGLALSIWSIVASTKCSNSCTAVTPVASSPGLGDPVTSPNLGAGDSVGPTGPTGPQGPTLTTSFAAAYGYGVFPAGTTTPSSSFTKGCTVTRDSSSGGVFTVTFDSGAVSGTNYSVVATAEAYQSADYNKGTLVCSIVNNERSSSKVQIRVFDVGSMAQNNPNNSKSSYNGGIFLNFMVAS